MEITEAKIKLMPSRSDRLQAFCTITIDNDFVIRDIKIIEGAKGAFVAMPSRKLTDKCPKCGGKNHLRARHCNDCGARLDENRATKDQRGRAKLHADIAHPINSACRERIQKKIIEAYDEEVKRSREPGYVPAALYDDEEIDEVHEFAHEEHEPEEPAAAEEPEEPAAAEEPEKPAAAEEPEEPAAAPEPEEPAAAEEPEKPLDELNRQLQELEEERKKEEEKGGDDDFSAGIL